MATGPLQRAIEGLETKLDPVSHRAAIDELAQIRADLADTAPRKPRITLPNLRLSFACKERWEDMVGDDNIRACNGCERPVFNISAMTRDEAERLLATRGIKPCVRFYRRPDGTIMTTDCPTGERREKRRLAVVASSLAAGAALATPTAAFADDAPADTTPTDAPTDPTTVEPDTLKPQVIEDPKFDDVEVLGGVPVYDDHRWDDDDGLGDGPTPLPALEWSIWSRFGTGFHVQPATVLSSSVARSVTPPEISASTPIFEAALSGEITLGIAAARRLRIGAFAEIRTTTEAIAGGAIVVEGLPPHPRSSSDFRGGGSVVVRVGGNAHTMTTALGLGYVGAWNDSCLRSEHHVVGARLVGTVNRSLDDARDWSATLGLEFEALGVLQKVFEFAEEH